MADVDVAIVGGGVIGLACAARLSRPNRRVLLLERAGVFGSETSGRNSGVIHAGIYYAEGSLKARLCVEGRDRLYARCTRERIPQRKCGKLIVACEPRERQVLERLLLRARNNAAGEVRWLTARELRAREPHVQGCAALWSPETGIIDVHALMISYRVEAQRRGCEFATHTAVTGLARAGDGYLVTTRNAHGEVFAIEASQVVNAAGLASDRVAELAGLPVDALGYRLHLCKGDYFQLAGRLRGLCSHLIYPAPEAAGLGVHVTLDLAGGLRAGPDATYVRAVDYRVDPAKAARFGAAVRRYLPEVRDEDLTPDYAGVRPKLQAAGAPPADFVIEEAGAHGLSGLVNLIGIESPGLTASEAIANEVARLLG